jgi:2-iminobutanoate/2-iminopropanoate deaminase
MIIMKKCILSLLLAVLSYIVIGQEPEKQVILSPDAPKAVGPYSQAILAGNMLYVSGQLPLDPVTGEMDTLNREAEIRRVMSNLGAVLKEAGMSYQNIVKATIFMTDIRNYGLINSVYGEYFQDSPPAREAIQVVALPKGAHVEISCIAVR